MEAQPRPTVAYTCLSSAAGVDAPLLHAPVLVRNRRGVIREVQQFPGGEGTGHLVRVDYEDDGEPASDWLLWEVENPSARRIVHPNVAGSPPLPPAEFRSLVRAAQWNSALPLPGMPGTPEQDLVLAPALAAFSPEGYQLVPLEMALDMPRIRLLIADDVGLGKTVEAALIASELLIRRRIRRVLVLCPPGLRRQWQQELVEKFGLGFQLVDGPGARRLARTGANEANPWKAYDRIIASYYYLRQVPVMEQFLRSCDSLARPQLPWDLLIIDEAHNLAPNPHGAESELTGMLRKLTQWFEHRLFITATPHNGYPSSFHGLLEILDPASFTRTSLPTAEQESRVPVAVVRRLKQEVRPPDSIPGRTIRALTPGFDSRELTLFAAVNGLRRRLLGWGPLPGPAGRETPALAVEVLGKRLLSSVPAFAASFAALLEGLDSGSPAGTGAVARASQRALKVTSNEYAADRRWLSTARTIGRWMRRCYPAVADDIRQICNALEGLGVDPRQVLPAAPVADARYDTLVSWLLARLQLDEKGGRPERAIIFTEYRDTLNYLARRLGTDLQFEGVENLHGDLREADRVVVVDAFTGGSTEARVLLTTDVGSEGLNLHTACRYLFHFDIPWNPARLEQRLGRLDRYGQQRRVEAFHFAPGDVAAARLMATVAEKAERMERDLGRASALLSVPPRALASAPEGALFPVSSRSGVDDSPPGPCARRNAPAVAEAMSVTAQLLGLERGEILETLESGLRTRSPDVMVHRSSTPGGYGISGLTREARESLERISGLSRLEAAATPFPQTLQWAARLVELRARSRWTVHQLPLPAGMDAALLLFVSARARNALGLPVHAWLSPILAPLARRGCWTVLEDGLQPSAMRALVGCGPPGADIRCAGGLGLLEQVARAVTSAATPESGSVSADPLAREVWAQSAPWVSDFMDVYRGHTNRVLETVLNERLEQVVTRLKARFAHRRAELAEAGSRGGEAQLSRRMEGLLVQRDSMGLLLPSLERQVYAEIAALDIELGRRKAQLRRLELHLVREEERLLRRMLPAEHTPAGPATVALEAVAVILSDVRRRGPR